MKKLIHAIVILLLCMGANYAQVSPLAEFNVANLPAMDDSLKPYFDDQGARSVWVAEKDLDQDGKPEILVTDYSNKGHVHVFELNGNTLELVWSSPTNEINGNSTPRWVQTGDLDGDGKQEIIYPNSESASVDLYVRVFEWDGNDNSFVHAIDLPADAFASQGVGNFRTNREVATVYDFDGDGSDELIMANRDNRTYILGITGDIPGFGAWQLEGGDPATVPKVGLGSIWHSVPAELDGDEGVEIVNHYWNFFGFWSINPTGPDSYAYPDTGATDEYIEFLRELGADAVAYMGIQPVDVDGDGNDEIAAIAYIGGNDIDYDPVIIEPGELTEGLYGWDPDDWAFLGTDLWSELAGRTSGSFWGIGAADLNGNGREEILLGGSYPYTIVGIEYNGSGSVLDAANYTREILWPGDTQIFEATTIRDSAGVIDTLYAESPFVSKIYAGSDINGNGKLEVIASFQSVYDSVRTIYQHWDGTAFVEDSVVKTLNPNQINLRILESDAATGLRDLGINLVTPDDYALEQNFPNPFNPTTSIRFTLPVDKKISLTVYDVLGNEVKTLFNEELKKGSYEVTWDGTNNAGSAVASGQYIYTLKYGNFSKSMKMTLLK